MAGGVAQHNDYTYSNCIGATFWISLNDFIKYFYILTISYNNYGYAHNFCIDQTFSYKWGCCEINMPETETDCFFNLFQLNDRFMSDGGVGDENYDYAEM